MKNIVILGSSGSIGMQAIDVISGYPELFNVVGLAVNSNVRILEEQIKKLNPQTVVIADETAAGSISMDAFRGIELLTGTESLEELAAHTDADVVLNALVGSVGLRSTLATIRTGNTLALANKESMVAGGAIVNRLQRETGADILPVDSEHNAIYQCLAGENVKDVNRLIITASGGPFRGKTLAELNHVTKEQALAHPRWTMGPKITVDSATLMNKGLEVIEARWLFDMEYEKIDVVVHPQSIIHSMVEFKDGSVKAQLGQTDMRIPIQYALSFPERLEAPVPMLNFAEIGSLTFEEPDINNFPCLAYAFDAIKLGKTYPAALNAANEEAVAAFLSDKISFTGIQRVIAGTLEKHEPGDDNDLNDIEEAERQSRMYAQEIVEYIKRI